MDVHISNFDREGSISVSFYDGNGDLVGAKDDDKVQGGSERKYTNDDFPTEIPSPAVDVHSNVRLVVAQDVLEWLRGAEEVALPEREDTPVDRVEIGDQFFTPEQWKVVQTYAKGYAMSACQDDADDYNREMANKESGEKTPEPSAETARDAANADYFKSGWTAALTEAQFQLRAHPGGIAHLANWLVRQIEAEGAGVDEVKQESELPGSGVNAEFELFDVSPSVINQRHHVWVPNQVDRKEIDKWVLQVSDREVISKFNLAVEFFRSLGIEVME